MNVHLRPNTSPSLPPRRRRLPKDKAYAVITHWRWSVEKCSVCCAVGSAMLTIVTSSVTISWATPRSARTAQRFGSVLPLRSVTALSSLLIRSSAKRRNVDLKERAGVVGGELLVGAGRKDRVNVFADPLGVAFRVQAEGLGVHLGDRFWDPGAHHRVLVLVEAELPVCDGPAEQPGEHVGHVVVGDQPRAGEPVGLPGVRGR